ARLPWRRRQRRRPAQRRAIGPADPELAAARDPRPRPPRRLGGGGGPGTGRAGLPRGMSDAGRHTIGRWLRDRARNTPDRTAIDYDGRLVSYRELDDGSDRLAAALAEAGLRRGDRLATLTGNSPEHVQVLFACARAGLILLPLSWRLSPAELRYQLEDADVAVPAARGEGDGVSAA